MSLLSWKLRTKDEQLKALAQATRKIDQEDKRAQREHKENVERLTIAMEHLVSLVLGIPKVASTAIDRRQEMCANINRLQAQFYKNRDFKRADDFLATHRCKNSNSSNSCKSKGTPISALVGRRKVEGIDDENFDEQGNYAHFSAD